MITSFDQIPDGRALIIRLFDASVDVTSKWNFMFLTNTLTGFVYLEFLQIEEILKNGKIYDPSKLPEPTSWQKHGPPEKWGIKDTTTNAPDFGFKRYFGMGHFGTDIGLITMKEASS
jgi:hypothetical protein